MAPARGALKKNDAIDVRSMAGRFVDHCQMFEHHFIVRGKDVIRHAQHYLTGLLGTQRRKNLERIERDVAESD